MDVKSSFAAQTYAQARTAAAPKPGTAEGSGLGKFASNFTEALANHEATARAAMTGGADPHALVEALVYTRDFFAGKFFTTGQRARRQR